MKKSTEMQKICHRKKKLNDKARKNYSYGNIFTYDKLDFKILLIITHFHYIYMTLLFIKKRSTHYNFNLMS